MINKIIRTNKINKGTKCFLIFVERKAIKNFILIKNKIREGEKIDIIYDIRY